MVMEMQMADKTWVAYMTERVPEYLEREILKVQETFYLTIQKIELEELREALPKPALSAPPEYDENWEEYVGM
eukprot:8660896-Prorocentrum_lima.AAC.1